MIREEKTSDSCLILSTKINHTCTTSNRYRRPRKGRSCFPEFHVFLMHGTVKLSKFNIHEYIYIYIFFTFIVIKYIEIFEMQWKRKMMGEENGVEVEI